MTQGWMTLCFSNLAEFKGKKLKTIESSSADPHNFDDKEKEEGLTRAQFAEFSKWMKDVLVDKITTVTQTDRLSSTPMIIVDHESASFRRMMKAVDPQNTPELPKQQVQVNGKHPLILNVNTLREVDPTLAKDAIEQIFDNALIQAGLVDDGRSMVPRINKILQRALENANKGSGASSGGSSQQKQEDDPFVAPSGEGFKEVRS